MSYHETYIAGVKFRPGAADVIAEMDSGAEYQLEAEPTNKFDKFAVKILLNGFHVGFVPGHLSEEITKLIGEGKITSVIEAGGNKIEIYYKE